MECAAAIGNDEHLAWSREVRSPLQRVQLAVHNGVCTMKSRMFLFTATLDSRRPQLWHGKVQGFRQGRCKRRHASKRSMRLAVVRYGAIDYLGCAWRIALPTAHHHPRLTGTSAVAFDPETHTNDARRSQGYHKRAGALLNRQSLHVKHVGVDGCTRAIWPKKLVVYVTREPRNRHLAAPL